MRFTTRSKILDYLRKQRTATVSELSRALVLTGANIRYHLSVLESDGLIEVIDLRRERLGRPVKIYSLSHRMLGDGLVGIANAALEGWLGGEDQADLAEKLRFVATRIGGGKMPETRIHLSQRLNQVVDWLNELHYWSHWEAGGEGPNIILGHCPYAAIISRNPELCRVDGYLLEQWIGLPVEQAVKLMASVKGYSFCAFKVVDITRFEA